MKEIKSKKTGYVQILSEEEFALLVRKPEILKRFTVTDLRSRPVISTEIPKDLKKIKVKKNEG